MVAQQDNAMTEFARKALDLPVEERVSLIGILQASLRRHPHGNGNRAGELLDIIGDIYGCDIPLRSRKAEYVWARAMVVYQLTREGYSTIKIGEMMGDITHPSVIHLRNKVQDMLDYPPAYRDIIPIWRKFQNKLI